MTSPIKPPSGPSVAPLAGGTPDAARVGGASGDDFKASLDAAAGGAPSSASAAEATGAQALTAALRSGELSPAQALDALVAQALSSADAQKLEPAGRAALEQHLRTMLAEDPALQDLTSDLSRT